MPVSTARSKASLIGRPLHAMLVPIPLVCFCAALVTDIVYWQTAEMQWANMSAWLLLVGFIVALFAAVAGLIDFLYYEHARRLRAGWIHLLGNVTVLVLALIDNLIHTRDAYTSVVPSGLVVSCLIVLALLVTGWNGWAMVYRHGVGVSGEDSP
jgi:uncharacterized membrane protein